jgi:hypothetical protein
MVCCLLPSPLIRSSADPAVEKGTNALLASARTSGQGMRVICPDPTNTKSTQPISGEISIETSRWAIAGRTCETRTACS